MNETAPRLVPLLLTVRDAAKMLAVSQRTLWTLSAPRGPLPVVRVGVRGVRYSVAALQAWIDQQQESASTVIDSEQKTSDELLPAARQQGAT